MGISRNIETRLEQKTEIQLRRWGWSVHFFTATGTVWALLGILAIQGHQWRLLFLLMGIALLVDGFDGTLARLLGVEKRLPQFDGSLLDNIVDFLTYVFVPAFLVFEAEMTPRGFNFLTACLILLSSAYQFCQCDAKTEDHFFKGFPSMWNAVVMYLLLLSSNPWVNLLVIWTCVALVFVPTKYVHPYRVRYHRNITVMVVAMWSLVLLVVVLTYPDYPVWLVWGSLGGVAYYVGISLVASRRSHVLGAGTD